MLRWRNRSVFYGVKVKDSSALDHELAKAFAHDGPAIIDVRTAKQARGFSLYMLRAVMSGKGDEVIDLGRTNWFRR